MVVRKSPKRSISLQQKRKKSIRKVPIRETISNPNSSVRKQMSTKIAPIIPFSSLAGFENIVENCNQKKWTKKDYLSKGKDGSIFIACETDNCSYVMKIQKADPVFYNEVFALVDLQKTELVPKIYAAWTCDGQGFIIMEKLEFCNTNSEERYIQVKKALDKLRKHGWLFVDIHGGNYMCKNKKKIVLVDFGWAVKRGPNGDEEKYPYHPLSKDLGKPVNWKLLELAQNKNLEGEINPHDDEDDEGDSFYEAEEAFNDYVEQYANLQ